MLTPDLRDKLAAKLHQAANARNLTHDQVSDVLLLIALDADYQTHLVATALRREREISALVPSDLKGVAEAALDKHLEGVTVEITDLGKAEAARA